MRVTHQGSGAQRGLGFELEQSLEPSGWARNEKSFSLRIASLLRCEKVCPGATPEQIV
jgi:hypothetical protein